MERRVVTSGQEICERSDCGNVAILGQASRFKILVEVCHIDPSCHMCQHEFGWEARKKC